MGGLGLWKFLSFLDNFFWLDLYFLLRLGFLFNGGRLRLDWLLLGFIFRLSLALVWLGRIRLLVQFRLNWDCFWMLLDNFRLWLLDGLFGWLLSSFLCLLLDWLLQVFGSGLFGSLRSGSNFLALVFDLFEFFVCWLWFIFDHTRLELDALFCGLSLCGIRLLPLLFLIRLRDV